ncbi:EF-hand [Glarea lozoyensis ATCC 20868]|uniref:EF-hand n=1 Tax=Glarea lozoyensis (strain ATCC 20868 / MF5171) TaxID=1116229 RepID=S3DLK7_GLAL2|nr:EF-hand [Glarea lozoyensis ATCC 20868]EPE27428.1 EF-hand [Glarea lozoyensis ATCC 20868]
MPASLSTASSTLTRSRATVLALTTITAVFGSYYIYRSVFAESQIDIVPGHELHRSNAIHRRRRRNGESPSDNRDSAHIDEEAENHEDGQIAPLADGATVVGDTGFEGEQEWDRPEEAVRNGHNIVQLLFRVSEDATRRNAYIHRGCACNSCGAVPIRGIRYRCSNCADYDLCEGCESQGLHIKTHIFYKIRVPGPSFGPKNIQPVWYAGDPDSVMRVLPKEITTKLSRETGFERSELDAYWEQWTFMASTDWRDDPDDINLAMDRRTFERCLVPSGGYRHSSPSLIFDRMFAFYDTNKDDLIGFPEFLHGIGYRKKKEKWARIFEGYDIDGDGYVERKDFLRMFRSYYVLYRQMHRDMLEGMEEQHMSCTDAHRLVTSRQPLSSAFGQDGRYPRAPDPRTGEGKTVMSHGDMEITDGKGVMTESNGDMGNREDIFRQNIMTLSRYHQLLREQGRENQTPNYDGGGYWDAILNPPQSEIQILNMARRMRTLRERAQDVLQGRINANADNFGVVIDDDYDDASDSDGDFEAGGEGRSWIPNDVTVTNEDAEAIEGPGKTLDDVRPKLRQTVIAHAIYRERAQQDIYDRWRRRQFYTDEEEGGDPPINWNDEDDVLAQVNVNGESSKSHSLPSIHSRSSSKVRFAEDMDDLDTRSNPSTSSRSVPERWGGMEIPDAEKDAGKEILYQVTQQAFNELLDPLFKKREDLALQAAETSEKRDRYRTLFTTPTFHEWALEKEAQDAAREETKQAGPVRETRVLVTRPIFPEFSEVEIEDVRQRPLQELLDATGFEAIEPRDDEPVNLADFSQATPASPGDGTTSPFEEFIRSQREAAVQGENFMTEDVMPTPISPASENHPTTPPYRDPTLPQFRPNSLPVFAPRFSRFAEDLPEISPSPTPPRRPDLDRPLSEVDNRPPRETLYQLWRADRAAKEAEKRGGWGRMNYEEFHAAVKKAGREGRGARMDYLGSWIDLCIP